MRHNQDTAPPDSAASSRLGMRHWVIGAIACVAVVWSAAAFVQEAYLSHKLSQQASALRDQNTLITGQNQAYRKDIQGITSGTAAEEEARQNGYSRSSERVYLVTITPNPSPSPSPSASPPRHSP